MKRVLIIQVAALGWDLWQTCRSIMPSLSSLAEPPKRLRPVFPALTAPVQATVTTGAAPAHHGIVANGFFSREFLKAFFW
ncbi:MAG: alkaline phosphatase family protein, partial [Phycisphaerae bacterium]|nr:alkaline phosphatase family protein [Phycisphaerae bacterium]